MSTLWTPADASVGLWIKTDDSAARVIDGSSRFEELLDKSGNGRHFIQTTAGSRPTLSAGALNGKDVAAFAGNIMNSAAAASAWNFMHDGTPCRLFALVRFGSIVELNAIYGLLGNNRGSTVGNRGFAVWFDDRNSLSRNNGLVHLIGNGGSTSGLREVVDNYSGDDFFAANSFAVYELFANPADSTPSARSTHIRNAQDARSNNSFSNAPSASNPTFNVQLGALNNGVLPMTGALAEMFILVGSDAEDQNVAEKAQGYIHHEWGLAGDLPSSHPYKSAAPTTISAAGNARFRESTPARLVIALDRTGVEIGRDIPDPASTPLGDYAIVGSGPMLLQAHAFDPEDWQGIWTAGTEYQEGNIVFSNGDTNDDSLILECTAATGSQESGATEPVWDATVGETTADNDLTWTTLGTVAELAPITNYYVAE